MPSALHGRWGEDVKSAALGVDGGSAAFVGVEKGSESCGVSVVSDASSSSIATVDEEPQENADLSVGTGVVSATISTGRGVGFVTTNLRQALRQVITDEGHPPRGTEAWAKVKSQ
jgi:hypothetical protein